MALSESEKRLLAQMEAALAAEDPKLVNAFRGSQATRRVHPRRAGLAGLGFLAGVGLLIGGMATFPGLSVLGFAIMVTCAVVGLAAWQPVPHDSAQGVTPPAAGGPVKETAEFGGGFMDKMEERWRRRHDDDI